MSKFFKLIAYLILTVQLYAQPQSIKQFNLPYSGADDQIDNFDIVGLSGSGMGILWQKGDSVLFASTADFGETWNDITILSEESISQKSQDLASTRLQNGTLIISYKTDVHRIIRYSQDNGKSWSDKILLQVGSNLVPEMVHSNFSQTSDGKVWLTFASTRVPSRLYYFKSDDGVSWPEGRKTLLIENEYKPDYAYLTEDASGNLILLYQRTDDDKFMKRSSVDNGTTWNDAEVFYQSDMEINRPRLIPGANNQLNLAFEKIVHTEYSTGLNDIFLTSSPDIGSTWSAPIKLTEYSGKDFNHNIISLNDEIVFIFSSERIMEFSAHNFDVNTRIFIDTPAKSHLYLSVVGKSEDIFTPPFFVSLTSLKLNANTDNYDRLISVKIIDNESISATIHVEWPGSLAGEYRIYDNGVYPDTFAGDNTYTALFQGIPYYDHFDYYIDAEDSLGNISKTNNLSDPGFELDDLTTDLMHVNEIYLPFSNNGIIGDVDLGDNIGPGGRYDDKNFLFSSGFYLSGLANGALWANGELSASRIETYVGGKVGTNPEDMYNILYTINKTDEAFGKSWLNWKSAVDYCGAEFYDGDNDGLYSPVDKNQNGKWDPDEDMPLLMGDRTIYCVFNDGMDKSERRYESDPLGIEIQQTAWAYSEESYDQLKDVIFVKYKIKNTGLVSDLLDSVYFSIAADGDLGDYQDDLVGCDTTLNSTFYYDDDVDAVYGANCPSFFTSIIQGPHSYIPGISFVDNNGNSIYDDLIDTPIDSAVYKNGININEEVFPGAANLNMTAFMPYYSSHYDQGDPRDIQQLRDYMVGGRVFNHAEIDPCNYSFGNIENGPDCSTLNNHFVFSGDPVEKTGWLCDYPIDCRTVQSTGPFLLKKNEPVEIIVAYTIGRGETSLASITEARKIVKNVNGFYSTNFNSIPVSVEKDDVKVLPTTFSLSQNYPNPFNPSTVVEYSIPEYSEVKLQVFDILGREVTTLVNQNQAAGNYKYSFNAVQLASGVYFYKLTAVSSEGNKTFSKTSKMMLLR